MEPERLKETQHVVTRPEAARYVLDETQRRSFEVFVGQERSASEAADDLGIHLNTMHYRIQRLLELGLLRVVREEKRAGRPVKVYRSIADLLRVPLEFVPDETLDRLLARIEAKRHEVTSHWVARRLEEHADDWEIQIFRGLDPEAEVSVALAPRKDVVGFSERALGNDFPALLWQETALDLPFAHAKQLQRDLVALLGRYEGMSRPGAARYLIKVGLVSMQE